MLLIKKKTLTLLFLMPTVYIQWILPNYPATKFFPASEWRLFSDVGIAKNYRFLYLRDRQTKEVCYFYACPRFPKETINSHEPFHLAMWGADKEQIQSYFEHQTDFETLNYDIELINENTLLWEKWKWLSKNAR